MKKFVCTLTLLIICSLFCLITSASYLTTEDVIKIHGDINKYAPIIAKDPHLFQTLTKEHDQMIKSRVLIRSKKVIESTETNHNKTSSQQNSRSQSSTNPPTPLAKSSNCSSEKVSNSQTKSNVSAISLSQTQQSTGSFPTECNSFSFSPEKVNKPHSPSQPQKSIGYFHFGYNVFSSSPQSLNDSRILKGPFTPALTQSTKVETTSSFFSASGFNPSKINLGAWPTSFSQQNSGYLPVDKNSFGENCRGSFSFTKEKATSLSSITTPNTTPEFSQPLPRPKNQLTNNMCDRSEIGSLCPAPNNPTKYYLVNTNSSSTKSTVDHKNNETNDIDNIKYMVSDLNRACTFFDYEIPAPKRLDRESAKKVGVKILIDDAKKNPDREDNFDISDCPFYANALGSTLVNDYDTLKSTCLHISNDDSDKNNNPLTKTVYNYSDGDQVKQTTHNLGHSEKDYFFFPYDPNDLTMENLCTHQDSNNQDLITQDFPPSQDSNNQDLTLEDLETYQDSNNLDLTMQNFRPHQDPNNLDLTIYDLN